MNFPIVDSFPPQLHIDAAETERGMYTIDGQTVTFLIDSLDPGETAHMSVSTTVTTVSPDGVYVNTATVYGEIAQEHILAQATAQVQGVSQLPSTGYPPQAKAHPNYLVWLMSIALTPFLGNLLFVRRR